MDKIKRNGISVAMATYNGEKYLKQQLDSIYSQDLLPDEVVVSDDGSSDSTLEILEEYHKKYGLTYSINEGQHGVNHNFYRAISLCNKEIIAICDQDDIWLPNKISTTYRKLCEFATDKPTCISSQCYHINSEGKLISETKNQRDTYGYDATLLSYGKNQNRGQGCSLMFNKQLKNIIIKKTTEYPEIKDEILYDGFISFTAALTGNKYNIGKRLMLYRHHSTNVIAKEGQKKEGIITRLSKNDFFCFIPQSRFSRIKKMLTWFSERETDPQAFLLCQKIIYASETSHFNALFSIMKIKELTLMRRFKIFSGTIAMDILKYFLSIYRK